MCVGGGGGRDASRGHGYVGYKSPGKGEPGESCVSDLRSIAAPSPPYPLLACLVGRAVPRWHLGPPSPNRWSHGSER